MEQALGNIVGTYYIQTLFANYEYQAHQLVERGEAVTPDILSGIMEQLFKQYFGDTLVFDELQKSFGVEFLISIILLIMYINMQQVLLLLQIYTNN